MLKSPPRVSIEVPIEKADAQDVRGRRFESFIRKYLSKQSYTVKERLRFTGAEVDLLCVSALSGDKIIVECKARRELVQSADVSKAYTTVSMRDCRQGWIFCISGFGSDAKGLIEEINAKHPNLIRTFDPNEIAQLLQESGLLQRPKRDALAFQHFSDESHLVVLEDRILWIETPIDPKSGERIGLVGYDEDGDQIKDITRLPNLRETDFRLREFDWMFSNAPATNRLSTHQSVVRVTPGESWRDFRPSRPSDFVGRTNIIRSIKGFFDSVISRETNTRIFGIKGRSGWGKSSLVLKLAETQEPTSVSQVYIFPVDCRAAQNFDFPDLAIKKALREAYADGFLLPLFREPFEAARNPFESAGYKSANDELRNTNRLLVIVFDQFEEIIHRNDLAGAFQRFGELAYAIGELCGNILLGFSWKTDGTTSTDNAGYQFWHSLSDHRRDFEIKPFNRDEAEEFLKQASESASRPISRDAKRFILEQYSGFPWLLKKLFVNHIETGGSIDDENQFLPKELDIRNLFNSDLSELSEAEHSALKFIAENSPVEIYKVSDRYGTTVTNSLIARRLIIQSGDAVSPYWDIFKEYILTKRIPFVPLTYVPSLSGRKLVSAIRLISDDHQCSYDELANRMSISVHTADNIVRDLTNMGLVSPNRQSGIFDINDLSGEEITRRIVDFVRRHVIYGHVENAISKARDFRLEDVFQDVALSYSFISPNRQTLETYIKKIVNLAANVGLIIRVDSKFVQGSPIQDILKVNIARKALVGAEVFRGHAPPTQVERLIEILRLGERTMTSLKTEGLRNATFSANALGLTQTEDGIVSTRVKIQPGSDVGGIIAKAAAHQETINYAIAQLAENPKLPGREIGEAISDMFQLDWSPSSANRHGTALRVWATWVTERLD